MHIFHRVSHSKFLHFLLVLDQTPSARCVSSSGTLPRQCITRTAAAAVRITATIAAVCNASFRLRHCCLPVIVAAEAGERVADLDLTTGQDPTFQVVVFVNIGPFTYPVTDVAVFQAAWDAIRCGDDGYGEDAGEVDGRELHLV